jgi:hypothetical protein
MVEFGRGEGCNGGGDCDVGLGEIGRDGLERFTERFLSPSVSDHTLKQNLLTTNKQNKIHANTTPYRPAFEVPSCPSARGIDAGNLASRRGLSCGDVDADVAFGEGTFKTLITILFPLERPILRVPDSDLIDKQRKLQ